MSTSNEPAKQLFGPVTTPSAQRPESFGGYSKGCLAGAVQLPETGPTWQAMRLSRNRNWGHPALITFVERLSAKAARQPGWAGLYVGDMSQPRGGPMSSGHASHQIGLDVDIWMLPPSRLTLTAAERENLSSISHATAPSGAYVNDSWTRAHHEIIKAAASDPAVARIFVFAGAKVQMCKDATGDRRWLRKVRPWWGHHYHFHVRLACPAGDAGPASTRRRRRRATAARTPKTGSTGSSTRRRPTRTRSPRRRGPRSRWPICLANAPPSWRSRSAALALMRRPRRPRRRGPPCSPRGCLVDRRSGVRRLVGARGLRPTGAPSSPSPTAARS